MKTTALDRQSIGENVRRLREALGLSVPEAAQKIGAHRSWWNLLESGALNFTIDRLESVASLLGVTVRDLLEPPSKKGRKAS